MHTKRRIAIVVLAVLGVGAVVAAVAAVRIRPWSAAPNDAAVAPRGGPKAVVDQAAWEAGKVERLEDSDHAFVVRNEGDAPLRLEPGDTSCSCTLAELPKDSIPPGRQATVRVATKKSWEQEHDKLKPGRLRRAVRLATNDPRHDPLLLEIFTTIIRSLSAEPEDVSLTLNPSQDLTRKQRTAASIVYSQSWDKFALAAIRSTVPGTTWRITPADPADLTPLHAKSGYRVEMTLSPDLPEGPFQGSLELSAAPGGGVAPRAISLPIHGRVEGRVSLSGWKTDGQRTLQLGTVTEGEPARTWFLLKLNDPHPAMRITGIETNPDFLRVRASPLDASGKLGAYRVEVELCKPRCCAMLGSRAGYLRLKTDHPRAPTIDVNVELAVVAR